MANMKLIEAKTVGSGGIASITFSAIPQTYTDIKILASSRDNRAGQPNDDISIQVGYNGTINTGSIYTYYRGYGTGSGVGSDNNSGTALNVGFSTGSTATASVFGNNSIYFGNYTSSNNKTVSCDGVSENNDSTSWQVLNAGLIATSNPITDIKLFGADASLLSEHTTFYLYGISSTIASGAKAYGGYVTEDANYFYHTFLASDTFTPTTALTADYLVVAGGGGGANGGGGAGGLRSTVTATGGGGSLETALSLTAQAYTVTVGAGGAGTGNAQDAPASDGNNSVFSTITSTGGGKGGKQSAAGSSGGSGGGGGRSGASFAGGAGTTNQGYAGGSNNNNDPYGNGGGGGAGAAGQNAPNPAGGYGGAGVAVSISGSSVYYAGGGGGGGGGSGGAGGLGGGGAGGLSAGVVATANTGGGGGGASEAGAGRAGGSGIVIVRYAK